MRNTKVFLLLPDGIGLRNFAYSKFHEMGSKLNFNIVYWNNTPFELGKLGLNEIKIQQSKSHPLTEIYKNVRKQIELNLFIKKTKDSVYSSYRFPFSYSNLKKIIKSGFTQLLSIIHTSNFGSNRIRQLIKLKERKTLYYYNCLDTLKNEKPAIVFCTNQRPMTAIAPLLAAQDLGIPTATFIFSWDNLPKATMVVETDYYFVWSEQMKSELIYYYPYIIEEQVFISGTPQFEFHFDINNKLSREDFFNRYKLDIAKKYICFSGDDFTTSPDDAAYLNDTALAIIKLNNEGHNLGVIFRRCPVDFSDRYDAVLQMYASVIVPIDPLWKPLGNVWNTIFPTKEDDFLLFNIAEHCEMVLNLGSSMVFDFICHEKETAYFRYNQKNRLNKEWNIFKCYRYVHFRSMPENNAVFWIDSPGEIADTISKCLKSNYSILTDAKKWFQIINQYPPQNASKRIWDGIKVIVSKE